MLISQAITPPWTWHQTDAAPRHGVGLASSLGGPETTQDARFPPSFSQNSGVLARCRVLYWVRYFG